MGNINFVAMKKVQFLLMMVLLIGGILNCSPGRNIEYNIYEGLRPEDKAFILATVEEGKEIFKVNCSKCHGIFTKGKKDIVNFSKEQMDDYKSAFVAEDEDNHAFASGMSIEELDKVLIFLQFYKRKNPSKTPHQH